MILSGKLQEFDVPQVNSVCVGFVPIPKMPVYKRHAYAYPKQSKSTFKMRAGPRKIGGAARLFAYRGVRITMVTLTKQTLFFYLAEDRTSSPWLATFDQNSEVVADGWWFSVFLLHSSIFDWSGVQRVI